MIYIYWDFAIPHRIARVQTVEEIINLVNLYNGKTNCYLIVNPYRIIGINELGNEIKETDIKFAFFDFDDGIDEVRKFVSSLLLKDIKFRLYASGNGWHVYVYCKGRGNGTNLRILQLSLLNDAKTSCDMHVVGDLMRVSRIPNTWNFSSQSYCVPLRVEELGKESEFNKEQRFEQFVYGSQILDLESYTETNYDYLKPLIVPNLEINSDIPLIPCIKNSLSKNNPSHLERFVITCYLSYSIRDGKPLCFFNIKDICEKIIEFYNTNATHWLDFNPSKTKYFVFNIVPKFDFPVTCSFIQKRNCCIGCVKHGI